jgi:hypothetical protein
MYKKIIYISVLITSLLVSCTKEAEIVSKQYPVLQTSDASDISLNGVTLNGEFISLGSSNTTEYGFVYSTKEPFLVKSDSLIITSKATKGKFSGLIEKGVAGNIKYNVKAFAKTENRIIYGNAIEFFSLGSKYNPWDFVHKPNMGGYFDLFAVSNNESGYVLFQSGDFYSYDPGTNTVSKRQNAPVKGNSGTYYASFNLGKNLYFISNGSQEVLMYDSNQWTKLGNRPFIPNSSYGCMGFSINNTGYFLTKGYFYSYDQVADAWSVKANIPSSYIYSANVVGNTVYVLGSNRDIWSFSPGSDTWQKLTQYPGVWHGKIVSFTQKGKIYYGLSYYGGYTGAPSPATDFWEYNPWLNTWKEVQNFPLAHSQDMLFTFSIGSFSYFGFTNPEYEFPYDTFLIFRFDTQKIK